MNKKKKIFTGAISIVVGVVISLGILKQLDVIDRDSVIGKVFYKDTSNEKQKLPESDEGYDEVSEEEGKQIEALENSFVPYQGKYSKISSALQGIEVLEGEKTVEYLGVEVTILDMNFTKKAEGFPPCEWESVTHDEHGTLTTDETYVVVDVLLKRVETDDPREMKNPVYLSGMYLKLFEQNQDYIGAYEPVSSDNYATHEEGGKGFFALDMEMGQEYRRKMVYLVEDEELKDCIITMDVNFCGVVTFALDARKCMILRK